jgi:hypothetical protein
MKYYLHPEYLPCYHMINRYISTFKLKNTINTWLIRPSAVPNDIFYYKNDVLTPACKYYSVSYTNLIGTVTHALIMHEYGIGWKICSGTYNLNNTFNMTVINFMPSFADLLMTILNKKNVNKYISNY